MQLSSTKCTLEFMKWLETLKQLVVVKNEIGDAIENKANVEETHVKSLKENTIEKFTEWQN